MGRNRLPRASFYFSALLYWLMLLSFAFFAVEAVWALRNPSDPNLVLIMSASVVLVIITSLLYLSLSSRCLCPSCSVKVFGASRCAKHSAAPKFMGSTRIPLTFSLLTCRSRVTCQYCASAFRFGG